LGGRKPTYLYILNIHLTSVKAVSIVPSGSDKTDVRRENTNVRWVGFLPLITLSLNAFGTMPFDPKTLSISAFILMTT
jgi:hypothetical protein